MMEPLCAVLSALAAKWVQWCFQQRSPFCGWCCSCLSNAFIWCSHPLSQSKLPSSLPGPFFPDETHPNRSYVVKLRHLTSIGSQTWMLQAPVKAQRMTGVGQCKSIGDSEAVGRRTVHVPRKGAQSQLSQNICFNSLTWLHLFSESWSYQFVTFKLEFNGVEVVFLFFPFSYLIELRKFLLAFFEVCIFHLYILPC